MLPLAPRLCRDLLCVVELLLDDFTIPAPPVPGAGVEGLAGDVGGVGEPGLGCAGFDGLEQQEVELFAGGVNVGGGPLDAIHVVVSDSIGDPCRELLALGGGEVDGVGLDVSPVPVRRVDDEGLVVKRGLGG